MVPADPHLLAEKYTCISSSSSNMFSENKCCYFTSVIMEEFLDDYDDVECYEWAAIVDGKVKIVVKLVDVEQAMELFNEPIKILKVHIFVKRTRNTHYNRLKENLKRNELIIHVTTAKITKIKNKTKSKVFLWRIIGFQYLLHVATHTGLMVHS